MYGVNVLDDMGVLQLPEDVDLQLYVLHLLLCEGDLLDCNTLPRVVVESLVDDRIGPLADTLKELVIAHSLGLLDEIHNIDGVTTVKQGCEIIRTYWWILFD